jgi:hypothetical protein
MHVEVDVQAAVELGDCCELGTPAPVNQVGSYKTVLFVAVPELS